MFDPTLPLSGNRPIIVTETTSNLNQILSFPVAQTMDGYYFLQDPNTGQVYRVNSLLYTNPPQTSNGGSTLDPNIIIPTGGQTSTPTTYSYPQGGLNETQTSGTDTTGTTGTNDISNLRGNPDTYFPCLYYALYIDPKTFRVKPGIYHSEPTLDPDLESLYPGLQKQCELWVDLYRCCVDSYGKSTSEKVGEILVATTKQLSYWEDCDLPDLDENGKQKTDENGNPLTIKGKKIVVQQYVDFDEIKDIFANGGVLNGVKWTGQLALTQDQLKSAQWADAKQYPFCPLKGTTTLDGHLNTIKDVHLDPHLTRALQENMGSTTADAFVIRTGTTITRAKIVDGKKVAIGESSIKYNVIYLCLKEGDCQVEKETPGPPGFFCVTIDQSEKVNIIDNGGRKKNADGTFTDYTDDELTVILGDKVKRELLGPRNHTIISGYTDGADANTNIFVTSSKKYKIQLTGAITDEEYIADEKLRSILANKKRNVDYVKVRWTSINEKPERYVYFLVFNTLEELLEYYKQDSKTNTSREKEGSRKTGQPVFGFPCEIQDTADYQDKWETFYTKYKICYRSDGAIFVETISDADGKPIYFKAYEKWIDDPTRVNEPVEGTQKYNPESNCCADAEFYNRPTDNPTSDNNTSDNGNNRGRYADSPAQQNFSVLEYDLDSAEWVSSNPDDPCDCVQYQIADVYCYYKSQKISLRYSKSLKNQITWVKDSTGKVITRRKPTADCVEDTEARVYHPFNKKGDIIKGKRKHITKGLFNLREHMDCYLTSSLQTIENKKYYYDVTDCENCDHGPYFSVAYGHISGSGSSGMDEYTLDKTPSDAIYSQYQSLCLEPIYPIAGSQGTKFIPSFKFVSASKSVSSGQIYAINFYRDNLSDRLDAGNFQINLAYLSGSFYANAVHTGSNVKVGSPFVMSFIDDSNEYDQGLICDGGDLISYNIVSGSLTNGVYENASINTYGTVYPQLGIVILDGNRLDEFLGFNIVTGSNINGDNSSKLFTSISGAASITNGRSDLNHLTARSIKYKTTQHYFVRVYPHYTNYSNMPSFVTGSNNYIKDKCFIEDPQVYITSVGLYDNYRNLVAVAKLSRPIKKNFDTDLLIKIRLNW